MRFPTPRTLLTAYTLLAVVALMNLSACSRTQHVTDSLTGVGHQAQPLKNGVPNPPPPPGAGVALKSFSLSPTSVAGGASSLGSLRLQSNAPAGGSLVTLVSSDPTVAQVPASITIAAGGSNGSFTVTTSAVAVNRSVTITATSSGTSLRATLNVTAPVVVAVSLATVSLAPAAITAGAPSTGTVTLTAAAAAGGALVTLSNSLPAVATMPASVTVAAGATSATFAITTVPSAVASSAVVTATFNAVARTATLAVAASNPCASVSQLGGTAALISATAPQFRTTRLRFDLVGDVPLAWINAMGTCATAAAPTVSFVSGTASVTLAGTATAITTTGAALAFGPLAMPIPAEAGTVLAIDAAGDVLQVIWPALAGLPAGPPVLRLNMAAWTAAVQTGVALDATLTFVARGADGSTATFTATGTNMIVPVFVP